MKIVFQLKDSHIRRAKLIRSEAVSKVMVIQKEEILEEYTTHDDKLVRGYYDSLKLVSHLLMTGNVLGFVAVQTSYKYVVDVVLDHERKNLTVVGCQEDIQRHEIMQSLKQILGKAYRIVPSNVEYDKSENVKLLWWESIEEYYTYRAPWDEYHAWLLSKKDGKSIECFNKRFHNENNCLQLLKAGLIDKARARFGNKLVDQILLLT